MRINTLAGRNRFTRDVGEGGGGGAITVADPASTTTAIPTGDFSPITSQADLDRIIQDRVRREQAKFKDYDSLKAKAEQFDILARESQTDTERAIEQARLEAYHEAMGQIVPQAVRAEFKAAAKGLLSDEALQSLLEDLDLTKYATDEGLPDEEKILRKISAFAPAKGDDEGRRTSRTSTGFGQGQRQASTAKRGEAGLAEAQRRFGLKADSQS